MTEDEIIRQIWPEPGLLLFSECGHKVPSEDIIGEFELSGLCPDCENMVDEIGAALTDSLRDYERTQIVSTSGGGEGSK